VTLEGERVRLRPLEVGDADELLRVNLENREFFAARESRRPGEYYTLDVQRARIEEAQKMLAESSGVLFGVFLSASEELIGILGLFGVIRGGFQEARIGYMIAERHSGQGHATEAVRLSLPFAFETLDLHRLETGVQLDNPASMRVLTKAGFRDEGISPSWVKIADSWVDCKRFALTREEWEERAKGGQAALGPVAGRSGASSTLPHSRHRNDPVSRM
jgi:[ribosomal protein S5]-alanine N-acetyltransferase